MAGSRWVKKRDGGILFSSLGRITGALIWYSPRQKWQCWGLVSGRLNQAFNTFKMRMLCTFCSMSFSQKMNVDVCKSMEDVRLGTDTEWVAAHVTSAL